MELEFEQLPPNIPRRFPFTQIDKIREIDKGKEHLVEIKKKLPLAQSWVKAKSKLKLKLTPIIGLFGFILQVVVTCISYYVFKFIVKCSSTSSRRPNLNLKKLKKLQNSYSNRVRCHGKSDFSDLIYVIFGFCLLLSPSVTPIITSNSILSGAENLPEAAIPVEGVVGTKVELPCDSRPIRRDDSVYMVLWFRGEESIPIYSFDSRGKLHSNAKRWSSEKAFGERAHFWTSSEPSKLFVNETKVTDEGIYRCRVDFRNSPSRESRIILNITVPPSEPEIISDDQRNTYGGGYRGEIGPYREIGPFLEGATIELTCIVRGKPKPRVLWILKNSEIEKLEDSSYHQENDDEVVNHLSVPNIKRFHHGSNLICQAYNTLLTPPITKTVTIELNLRPLLVKIQHHHNKTLTTDTQYQILCETIGSSNPKVAWFLHDRELRDAKIDEESRFLRNVTISRLMFVPTPKDDGMPLICRAENPNLPGSALEDTWILKVVYPPILTLRLGSSLNPNNIKANDDVYFDAIIKANPPVHKISWFRNGVRLHHNLSSGIILSNQSLVLQKVSRESAGNISAEAINDVGNGVSNEVALKIMYAPNCQSTESMSGTDALIIAASRSEEVDINCEMDALPNNLKFHWTHTNNVGESSEISQELYTNEGSRSILSYNLRAEDSFGTLLCWAHNSIGPSDKPCVFQLVPADVPQPVENCSIINRTSTSVEITCTSSFDGGLPQHFYLEAYQSAPMYRRGLQFNISSANPAFTINELDPDGTFHFKIYSVNRKGKSSPQIMDGIALHYPAMQSAKARELEKATIAIIVGAGSAVVLSIIAFIVFVVQRRKNPIVNVDLSMTNDKSYDKDFRSTNSRRSSGLTDELYNNSGGKKHAKHSENHQHNSTTLNNKKHTELPFNHNNSNHSNHHYDDDGDPDLIPSNKGAKTTMGLGKMYTQLSNGEINQHWVDGNGTMEKIPLRTIVNPNVVPLNMDYGQGNQQLPNYATFRGKPNGNGRISTGGQMGHISSSGSFHDKPTSSVVVNIDTRLIKQLASNQLPESCV